MKNKNQKSIIVIISIFFILGLLVGNSKLFTGYFLKLDSDKNTIEITDNNELILSINLNKNYNIDTSTLVIEKQSFNSEKGSILIKGLNLENKGTKTIYLDNLDKSTNYLCIKDAEINSITEISTDCNAENEFLILCPGFNYQYSCQIIKDKYKISGLRHSGVIEVTIEDPTTSTTTTIPITATSTTLSGSDDSGDGGSGNSFVPSICDPNWVCDSWSSCFNNIQTRTCFDAANCDPIGEKEEQQICSKASTITTSTTTTLQQPILTENRESKLKALYWFIFLVLVLLILIIIIIIYYRKKKEKRNKK